MNRATSATTAVLTSDIPPADAHVQDVIENAGVYKTLLESTNAIPWKINWATMEFAYIGPQIESLLGWTPDSWKTVDDWVNRMHAEDREYVVNFCVSQSKAGVDHEADYRALKPDGSYLWIRDVVHVVRNEMGEVESLIGFMFDISERKAIEHEMQRLNQELEHLSFTDGLTGISNRRLFDTRLESEWAHACTSGLPVSLIVLDIDHFKNFNDIHGHIAGDDCLKRVAGALLSVARRSSDVVARFGGEEFIVLLPDTNQETAYALAQSCAAEIAKLEILHGGSDVSEFVTASFGVGTARACERLSPEMFVKDVDRVLYRAKTSGRNTIALRDAEVMP